MATITDILHFAARNRQFARKDLIAYLKRQQQSLSSNAVSMQLNRLVKDNELMHLERGIYGVSLTPKKIFIILLSDDLIQLNLKLKAQFPFTNYCLWSSKAIYPYMHHIPNIDNIYIDVERDATVSVFNFLNKNNTSPIFLCPDLNSFNLYVSCTRSIIVRTLVSESPSQILEGVNTPTIEKILVDIAGDVEFDFVQGTEIAHIYKNIMERHIINTNKLFRYAVRRGRRAKVEQLFNNEL